VLPCPEPQIKKATPVSLGGLKPITKPLQNASFCPISALAPWNTEPIPLGSGSNFNPRNTQCITVVKIIAFLELEQKYEFFKGLVT
jgi:hypothetical protein